MWKLITILLFSLIYLSNGCNVIVGTPKTYTFPISSTLSFGIYRTDYLQEDPSLCLNPNCSDAVVINLDVTSYVCGNINNSFVQGNTSNVDFDVVSFLDSILNGPDCEFTSFRENNQLLTQLESLSTNLSINVIEGGVAPSQCNPTQCTPNTTIINLIINDSCLGTRCQYCQYTTPYIQPIYTRSNTLVEFNVSFCLNRQDINDAGFCRSESEDWILIGRTSNNYNTPNNNAIIQPINFEVSGAGILSATFEFNATQPLNYIQYYLYNNATNTSIPVNLGQYILAQRSNAVLAGGKCEGVDCCNLVSECAATFHLLQAFPTQFSDQITDTYCPFPVCNWRYKYDEREQLCVLYVSDAVSAPTHVPYTSLSTCSADIRSDNNFCAEPLTRALRICKANVGLY